MIIYCVEDDIDIKELIVYALKNNGYNAIGFTSYKELYNAIKLERPDLILLDIMLPEKDGIEILKELKSNIDYSEIPIIFLTAKTSEYDRIKGLDLGADDYIVKPFSVMEMLARVKAVLRRVSKGSSNKLKFKNIAIDNDKRLVSVDDNVIDLTYKEYELLNILIINIENVLSRDLLLEKIWGYDFIGDTRTVDVHIGTLRKKIGESGKYIQTVRNIGYKMGEIL